MTHQALALRHRWGTVKMFDALFSFSGRLRRLAYFGYSIVAGLIGSIPAVIGALSLIYGKHHNEAVLIVVAVVILGISAIYFAWTSFAIGVKRLHDMDMSGYNQIWIIGLSAAGQILRYLHQPVTGIVIGVFSLGVSLWLLFAPGSQGGNRFG
ncbi:MAG: hypothetical protein B7Z78_10340 [Rhodospirillales bacterium 20-60-12]|nr:MAG: hypothetical protein B7Z78_10340 [Rhodospirillales bacterium 20-60-12]